MNRREIAVWLIRPMVVASPPLGWFSQPGLRSLNGLVAAGTRCRRSPRAISDRSIVSPTASAWSQPQRKRPAGAGAEHRAVHVDDDADPRVGDFPVLQNNEPVGVDANDAAAGMLVCRVVLELGAVDAQAGANIDALA